MTDLLTRRSLGVLLASTMLCASALPGLASGEKTFALVQINQQALFFNEMNRGAEEAAEAAGVKLVIFNANNDPAAQNSAIETYIQDGIDGLAVVAIDVNGIMPAVEQAAAAGIPVVAIVDTNASPDGVDYVIPGNDDAARAIALYCDLVSRAALDGMSAQMDAAGIDLGEMEETPLEEHLDVEIDEEAAHEDAAARY